MNFSQDSLMPIVGIIVAVALIFDVYFSYSKNKVLIFENKVLKKDRTILENDLKALDKRVMDLTKELSDAQARTKHSGDVLAVLNDMRNGGAMIHVERIDKNDIFYHSGGQYR